MKLLRYQLICHFSVFLLVSAEPCAPLDFKSDSIVCVCNSTYCDTVSRIDVLSPSLLYVYTSSQGGLRFDLTNVNFETTSESTGKEIRLTPNVTDVHQIILGFGGAFTDSAAINILKLNHSVRKHLMNSYFSKSELGYTLGRVPIACTDFSTHSYSYDGMREDEWLLRFSLTSEDRKGKIPLIKQAAEFARQPLKLFASTWAAPPWMKTDNKILSGGKIRSKYYDAFARYHVKFLERYKFHGLEFWAVSSGNEPDVKFFSVNWTPEELTTWVAQYFGPHLNKSFPNVKRLIFDETPQVIPEYSMILENETSKQYVDLWGIHPYFSAESAVSGLKFMRSRYPNIPTIISEYSVGAKSQPPVLLGSWSRAEDYSIRMIKSIATGAVGWIDWNLALNLEGGPNWRYNNLDSPIIVKDSETFYKQPYFYIQGHFSAFVPPGSRRIGVEIHSEKEVNAIAFLTPERNVVIIIINFDLSELDVIIQANTSRSARVKLPQKSIATLIYSK